MFPLTNMEILGPLIVSYTLEGGALESLASQYQAMVTTFHQQGMDEEEISTNLFALMQSSDTRITALQSTQVYKEPEEVNETISIWLKAKNTALARDELLLVCQFIFMLDVLAINGSFRFELLCEFLSHLLNHGLSIRSQLH